MVAIKKVEEFTGKNISPAEEVFLKIDDLYNEAKNWADGADIENEQQHDAAKAVYDALHDAGKKADELRKDEKKPLDDEIKVIQDRFNPYIQPKKGKVDLGKSALGTVLTKWRQKVEAEKKAAAEKAAREADEKRRAAESAMQTSAGNLEAREEAEAMLAEAKQADKDAARANKAAAAGNGLRTSYAPRLTNLRDAVSHYWGSNPGAFETLVCELAVKDVRAGKHSIPGFVVEEEKKAI